METWSRMSRSLAPFATGMSYQTRVVSVTSTRTVSVSASGAPGAGLASLIVVLRLFVLVLVVDGGEVPVVDGDAAVFEELGGGFGVLVEVELALVAADLDGDGVVAHQAACWSMRSSTVSR